MADTKNTRGRLWWLLSFLLVAALVAVAVRLTVSPEVEQAEEPISSREKLRALSDIPTFRAAFIAANGGERRLEELQGILSTGTFESGGQEVPFRTIKRRPDKSVTTLKMPDYDLSFIVNGPEVWQRVEQPGMDPRSALIEGKQAEAMQEMGNFFDPVMSVVLNQPERIESIIPNLWKGETCLLMQIRAAGGDMGARVYVDPDTMAPIARVENFADGRERTVLYDDYRKSDGGTLEPHSIETFIDGERQNRVLVEKIRPNPGIVGFIFEYPEANPAPPRTAERPDSIPR